MAKQDRLTPEQDLFTPKQDLFTPKQDRLTPKQDRLTPEQDRLTPERAAEQDRLTPERAYVRVSDVELRLRALAAQRQLEKDLALQRWYEEAMLDSWELACDSMDDDIVTLSAMAHTLKELGQ
jgi:hypothetical protein